MYTKQLEEQAGPHKPGRFGSPHIKRLSALRTTRAVSGWVGDSINFHGAVAPASPSQLQVEVPRKPEAVRPRGWGSAAVEKNWKGQMPHWQPREGRGAPRARARGTQSSRAADIAGEKSSGDLTAARLSIDLRASRSCQIFGPSSCCARETDGRSCRSALALLSMLLRNNPGADGKLEPRLVLSGGSARTINPPERKEGPESPTKALASEAAR